MKTVLLDTNFLIHCCNQRVDFISELQRLLGIFELCIIDKTITELEKVLKIKKFKFPASLALSIINTLKIKKIFSSKGHVDDLILKICKTNNFILATNDYELKKKAKKNDLEIIYLRKGKYLEIN